MTKTSYELSDWLTYLSHNEIDFLKALANNLPPDPIVVNIGAGCGTGALALLESRGDLQLVTIDIQRESSPYGCLAGEESELRKSGVDFVRRYGQIEGDSKSVPWDRPAVDMVFVDGDHTYAGCAGDIYAWLPRLKRGGILALHDYHKRPDRKPHQGVDRAVDDLLVDKYKFIDLVDTLVAFWVLEYEE